MSEGIEVTIYDVPRGMTAAALVGALRELQPSKVRVDAAGHGKETLATLQHWGIEARELDKRRRKVMSRDEVGRPMFVEGPDDELAEHFDGEWRGQYYLARFDGEWRAYELAELPSPQHDIVTLRWVRVTDPKVLRKLGPWRF